MPILMVSIKLVECINRMLMGLDLQYDKDGKSVVMTLEQLLPMSFGPEKLLTTEDMSNGLAQ